MRLTRALLDLTFHGYRVLFEENVANCSYVAVSMSNHGLNVRANIKVEDFKEDYICAALKQLQERLDLEVKGIRLK